MEIVITQGLLGHEGEGELVSWLVEEGASVEAGTPVAELEMSKVVIEVPAPGAGTLRRSLPEGSMVELGTAIGRVEA
jgi:acetyl-CoA/propionyl-CoA carboxylase biotin carboxyl carrier protein